MELDVSGISKIWPGSLHRHLPKVISLLALSLIITTTAKYLINSLFLYSSLHLYKRVCPTVGPSVGPSVRPSVNSYFQFSKMKGFWAVDLKGTMCYRRGGTFPSIHKYVHLCVRLSGCPSGCPVFSRAPGPQRPSPVQPQSPNPRKSP